MTKVLIVLTNHEKFETINRAAGLWLSEATHFNKVMKDHNIAVDYVSPQGGYVPVDPGSLAPDQLDDINNEFYSDAEFRNQALGTHLNQLTSQLVTMMQFTSLAAMGPFGIFPTIKNSAQSPNRFMIMVASFLPFATE